MSFPYEAKVLEQCHVSPPPNSVSPTSLPLTFFDIPWLLCMPMQRIFFYEFPFSTSQFMHNILPNLKLSLSLALQYFFPLVGTLVCPARPTKPHILCKEGDSVTLTIVEATGDFNHLLKDLPRGVRELHPLVPNFQDPYVSVDKNVEYFPLLALQVTIFEKLGICIGARFRHVVADGRSSNHFIKSWASIFRSNGVLSCLQNSMPLHNRNVINDPYGFEDIFLDQWWACRSYLKPDLVAADIFRDKVRATFLMSRFAIDRLKQWISKQCKNNEPRPPHVSAFVAVCAFVWVCLVKSRAGVSSDKDEEPCHFCFVADCRDRYELHIPETYFGNCLAICYVSAKRGELMGENGVWMAAKAIGHKIMELESGVLEGAEKWLLKWHELSQEHLVTVAGSPKLSVYETDFGWGKPKKSEVVQIDASGAIALAESRDGEGGVEVGLALSRVEMGAFTSIFEEGKDKLY